MLLNEVTAKPSLLTRMKKLVKKVEKNTLVKTKNAKVPAKKKNPLRKLAGSASLLTTLQNLQIKCRKKNRNQKANQRQKVLELLKKVHHLLQKRQK